jgi:hypothetical protein
MRRLVIVVLCLTIAGCLLVLAARFGRARAVAPADEPEMDTSAEVDREAEADPAPADEADVVSLASRDEPPPERETAPYDGERVQAELAQLRDDVVAGVDRRPLFAMAQARGLPNHELFSMSSEHLLDAILDAEALPPTDVLPSPENADRIRSVMAEAFQRQDEYAAEEAASRDAG